MSKIRNALIVGGNSQDGKYLSSFLLKKNYCVHSVFNKNRKKIDKKIKEIKINFNDQKKLKNYLKKFDKLEIYYFPSINIASNKIEEEEIFRNNINLNFTQLNQLLKIISNLENKKKIKIFYSSSSHIFKANKFPGKKSEDSDYITDSYYGFAKLCGLRLCEFYRDKYNLFINVGILYSHFSKYSKSDFIIPKIYNQLKNNEIINVQNANSTIDFLHAKQVIKMIYRVMKLNKPNTFIISSGKKIKIKKICEILGKLMKKKVKINSVVKKKKIKDFGGNIKKITKHINVSKKELGIKKNLQDFIYE
jgi:GDPmannose 4,6-dehydratase